METQEHIWKGPLTNMEIMVLLFIFFILTQSTSALSTNPDQANWETCTFESRDFSRTVCNPGSVRNSPTLGCSPRKPCCACPSTSFMDKYNNCTMCKPFTDCEAEGKQVLIKGSATQDYVCGDDILPTTVESSSTEPVIISTLGPALGSTRAVQPNETKPHPGVNITGNPPGSDEGGGGTNVIKFDGGSALIIFLCTLVVICICVIILFVCYPKIPQKLHALFSKEKPERNIDVIHMKEQGDSSGVAVDV